MDSVDFCYIVMPLVCSVIMFILGRAFNHNEGCVTFVGLPGCFGIFFMIFAIMGLFFWDKPSYSNRMFFDRMYYEAKYKNGDKSANLKLGDYYFYNKNYEKALKCYEQADLDRHGSAQGYYNLGYLYENGLGEASKNIKQSIYWYEKAVDLGHDKAKRNLAFNYYKCGYNKKAFDMAKLAVDNGFECAYLILADCYRCGNVVEKDIKLARNFYGKATSSHHYSDGSGCGDGYCDLYKEEASSKEEELRLLLIENERKEAELKEQMEEAERMKQREAERQRFEMQWEAERQRSRKQWEAERQTFTY